MKPIASKLTEALQIGDTEPIPTAMLNLYEYGMVYQRICFGIKRDEDHPDGWLVDTEIENTFRIEMVMN